MTSLDRERIIVEDAEALALAAAEVFSRQARESVAVRGRFTVALAGGSTPRLLYARLTDPAAPFLAQIPWSQVHVFWGDERHVPPDDPQSNYWLAREQLLSRAPIPAGNLHRIEAERPDAKDAAAAYEAELIRFFSLSPGQAPRLDLVLLGMGTDGHTASLFPGSDALEVRDALVAAPWIAKFSSYRITLTLPVFNASAAVQFLVSGKDKAETLRAVFDPKSPPDAFPCQRISPANGRLTWLVDRAAASALESR
ncbi:MAG: 6-phosphogluconolactonase [Acidobacteriota bacterium]